MFLLLERRKGGEYLINAEDIIVISPAPFGAVCHLSGDFDCEVLHEPKEIHKYIESLEGIYNMEEGEEDV